VNVYIVVEVAARELEARLLLALVAAGRGHDVLLGDVDPRLQPDALPAGVFHDKSLTPGQEMRRQTELAGLGHLVTSQDEEHGLLQPDYGLFMDRRFAPEALDVADRVMTWGPHDHGALREGRPAHADRLRMTGSPRVDLWRPEMLEHHRREPLPETAGRPYVLFANNVTHLLGVNRFTTMIADKRGKYFEGTDDPLERQWFVEMAAQKSAARREGGGMVPATFDWNSKITVKLNFMDIAEMLTVLEGRALRVGGERNGLFHANGGGNTLISFQRNAEQGTYYFGLSCKRGKDEAPQKLGIMLSDAEATGLRCLFQTGLFFLTFSSLLRERPLARRMMVHADQAREAVPVRKAA
jgi:hypothetical protein